MKFFYINNTQCTSCGRCNEVCATGAIYLQDDRRYLNYDRCTSCGSCLKTCNVGAVTIENLDHVVREMDSLVEEREHAGRLENELIQLKEQVRISQANLQEVFEMLPLAVFVADEKLRIVVAGQNLVRALNLGGRLSQDTPKGLAGVGLRELLPDAMMRQVEDAASSGQIFSSVTEAAGRPLSFSVAPIAGGNLFGIARELGANSEVKDEIASKLREAIESQLATVQKIGFLLGEEISAVVADISSVIDIVEKGEKR